MPNADRGTFRFYALWLDERPAHFWPEVALRLPAEERVDDCAAGLGTPREITRSAYYDFPAGARATRQPKSAQPGAAAHAI